MARNFSPVIEHPVAYEAARKAYILANANKTFYATYPDHIEVLNFIAPGRIYDEGQCVGYNEGFLGSLASAFDQYGKLTEGQVNAVRKCIERRNAQRAEWASKQAEINATRKHLGAVGEKITLTLTVSHIVELDGLYGTNYIFICEDEEKNVVIYKGKSNAIPNKGETATVVATVKEHGVRDGVKQTVIQRPKAA